MRKTAGTSELQRLGVAIRQRREERGFTQEDFARSIKMHRAYYSAVERGGKNMQYSTLRRICDGLDVAIWEVVREAERNRR